MKKKDKNKKVSLCKDMQRESQVALLVKIFDDHTMLTSGEIREMLYDAIDAIQD